MSTFGRPLPPAGGSSLFGSNATSAFGFGAGTGGSGISWGQTDPIFESNPPEGTSDPNVESSSNATAQGVGNGDGDRDTFQTTTPGNPSIERVNGEGDNGGGWDTQLHVEEQDADSNPSVERSGNGIFGATQTSTWGNPYTTDVNLQGDEVRRDVNDYLLSEADLQLGSPIFKMGYQMAKPTVSSIMLAKLRNRLLLSLKCYLSPLQIP